eukprot:Gb_05145 [translate_table: standard]
MIERQGLATMWLLFVLVSKEDTSCPRRYLSLPFICPISDAKKSKSNCFCIHYSLQFSGNLGRFCKPVDPLLYVQEKLFLELMVLISKDRPIFGKECCSEPTDSRFTGRGLDFLRVFGIWVSIVIAFFNELDCWCQKAPANRRGDKFILGDKSVQRHRAVFSGRPKTRCISSNNVYRRSILKLSSSIHNGRTSKQAILTGISSFVLKDCIKYGRDLEEQQVKSLTFSRRICNRTQAGINFFREKQPQNQQRDFQSLLIRSLVFFTSKQNFLFDFCLNNWSEYERVVLNADSDGGQGGGGFTFLRGLGGGGENYSRNGRKSSKKWWWLLHSASVLGLVLVVGVYSGILRLPNFTFNAEKLKEMIIQVASFGILVLILLSIVGAVAFIGSILLGSMSFLSRNLKFTVFQPRRKIHNPSLVKSLAAGTVLSAAGLGILFSLCPQAFLNEMCCYLGQLKQKIRAALMLLAIHIMSMHSLCKKKVASLINSATTRGSKPRRKKGTSY